MEIKQNLFVLIVKIKKKQIKEKDEILLLH